MNGAQWYCLDLMGRLDRISATLPAFLEPAEREAIQKRISLVRSQASVLYAGLFQDAD